MLTQELKQEALQVLEDCTVDGAKIRLPENVNTDVFGIIKQALEAVGSVQYHPKKKIFIVEGGSAPGQPTAESVLADAKSWLSVQEVETFEHPVRFEGTPTIDAEAETIEDEPEEEKKPKQFIKERRSLKYEFSASESIDLAQQLARETTNLAALEEEKASIAKQFGSKIAEIKATCNKLSHLVTNGYEYRDTEVEIHYNQPVPGKKTIIRLDRNTSTVEKMEPYEYNLFNQPSDEYEAA